VRRFAIAFAAAGFALVAAAGPAWAHVEVEPNSAPKGSDQVLAFVVPNEEENATTTKVVVQFPRDHPIGEAQVEAIAGWTAVVTPFKLTKPIETDDGTFNEAVDKVTWTASGAGIPVDGFQEFRVSVGLPDDADSLTFPTIQTYSDGTTVNWIQETPAGGPEPDDPAPVLTLTEGGESGHTTPTTAAAHTTDTASKSDVDSAKTLGTVGIVIAVVALAVGIGALVSRRKQKA
jgi:uncharacterized protein YcnI